MGQESNNYVEEFRTQFPDLPESLYTQNQDMAREMLLQMRQSAEADRANAHQRVLDHFREQFPQLTEALIFEVVSRHGWDVDAAAVDLVAAALDPPQPEELEIVRMFCDQFPKERILELYRLHEGDAEATANALLDGQFGAPAAAAAAAAGTADAVLREQVQQRERAAVVRDLVARFEGLSEAEVTAALQAAAWDVEEAAARLLPRAEQTFVGKLAASFPEFAERQIRRVVYAADWNLRRAKELLAERRSELAKDGAAAAAEGEADAAAADAAAATARLNRSVLIGASVTEKLQQRKDETERRIRQELEEQLRRVYGPASQMPQRGDTAGEQPPLDDDAPAEPLGPQTAAAAGPPRSATLSLHAKRIDAGDAIEVAWELGPGQAANTSDWIGLFRVGRADGKYTTYRYVASAGGDAAHGTVSFTVKKDGHYELRMFAAGSYARMGVSDVLRVGPVYSLATEQVDPKRLMVRSALEMGPPAAGVWIGLYAAGETNNRAYYSYQYRDAHGSQVFDVPKAGAWEVRLFTNSSYYHAATATAVLAGDASLKLRAEGERAIVTFAVPTLDTASDLVWVGLFFTDAPIDSQNPRRWKWVRAKETELVFNAPRTPGKYHARLFAHRAVRPVLISEDHFARSL